MFNSFKRRIKSPYCKFLFNFEAATLTGESIRLAFSHQPTSPPSTKALNLLRASLSSPYPPNQPEKKPLDFNLDVVEGAPTKDQMNTIMSYLPSKSISPSHAFLSAHFATPTGADRPEGVPAIAKLAQENPSALKWPIVVDWNGGQAAIGEIEGVKGILETLRKRRDGELKEDEVDQPKGWFT
ncbi:hypothetical protein DXG01_015458 [Tephrocybe rancida]|nr:hypothetical protein DXG01_015458 [Tephrocybe rancida]